MKSAPLLFGALSRVRSDNNGVRQSGYHTRQEAKEEKNKKTDRSGFDRRALMICARRKIVRKGHPQGWVKWPRNLWETRVCLNSILDAVTRSSGLFSHTPCVRCRWNCADCLMFDVVVCVACCRQQQLLIRFEYEVYIISSTSVRSHPPTLPTAVARTVV